MEEDKKKEEAGETSPSSNEMDQPYTTKGEGSISRMMKNINQKELIEAAVDAENFD